MELQGIQKSQHSVEKNKIGITHLDFRTYYKGSNHDCVKLAQGYICRSME